MIKIPYLILLSLLASGVVSAQEYDVVPTDEVKRGVEQERGGPPELYRQVMEQNAEYDNVMDYVPQAKPIRKTVALNMDSLDVPFEVQVARGYITTLTFIDVNGNPFPVRVSRAGNPSSFIVCAGTKEDCKITEADMDIAHILTIGTPKLVGRSNLRVFFKGLYKAVQIPLVIKKTSYHDEVTIMLPVSNPDVREDITMQSNRDFQIKDSDDYYARALLDGISVKKLPNAVELTVDVENRIGQKARASSLYAIYAEGNTYVKTTLRKPNPQATAITTGFMGEVVYRFSGRTSVVTGFDESGQILVLKLTMPDNVLGYKEYREE